MHYFCMLTNWTNNGGCQVEKYAAARFDYDWPYSVMQELKVMNERTGMADCEECKHKFACLFRPLVKRTFDRVGGYAV